MNKKFLSLLVFVSLLVAIVVPVAVSADEAVPTGCTISTSVSQYISSCPASGPCQYSTTGTNCGMCCMINSVLIVTNYIFIGLILLSALMIIIGAFVFVTSGGNPDKTTQARNYIIFAAVGLAAALLAKIVPSLVKFVLGVS